MYFALTNFCKLAHQNSTIYYFCTIRMCIMNHPPGLMVVLHQLLHCAYSPAHNYLILYNPHRDAYCYLAANNNNTIFVLCLLP